MSHRTHNQPAARRVSALEQALKDLLVTEPMGVDTETLASALRYLNRAHRWVSGEIEDRMVSETAREATC
ncbi:MAG: hypothetical protein EOM21_19180 [Gammaproteobacteria bacterium]|nr:hypothetical protein [Gammaproteobacteria bacterium]